MAGNHKTKLGLAQLKNGLFWLCVSCLVGISISQLWTTFKDWNDHPIESFTVEVPKHKVPFPSVTVCLEVFGLWSDLRSFLNHLEFTDDYKSLLPLAFKQFVKINLMLLVSLSRIIKWKIAMRMIKIPLAAPGRECSNGS